MNVGDKVISAISNLSGCLPVDLSIDTRLANIGLDSLDEVELIMELEEEFGIEMDDAILAGFETIGGLVGYVNRLTDK